MCHRQIAYAAHCAVDNKWPTSSGREWEYEDVLVWWRFAAFTALLPRFFLLLGWATAS